MRDKLAPMAAVRRGEGCDGDPEVDGAALVGMDEELIAAIVDAVAHAGLARRHQARHGMGVAEIDQPALGGLLVARGDDTEAARGAFLGAHEPAVVGLRVDQDVGALRRAQAVAVDVQRPVIVVEADVIEERRIEAPDDAAAGLIDDVGQVDPGLPVAHADGEQLRAADVGAPCFEAVIGGMARAAEIEVGQALGHGVAVEQHLDLAAVARHATDRFVLAARVELPEIGERPVGLRHARIVFLDAAAHLGDQRFLQRLQGAEKCFGMAVLGFQIRPDVGSEQGRVAQHFLPFGIFQPGIVVNHSHAMQGPPGRPS